MRLLDYLTFVLVIASFSTIGSSDVSANKIVSEVDPIINIMAVDEEYGCDEVDIEIKFQAWINNLGGATVDGFCMGLESFAAVPGTYDTTDFSSFPGVSVGELDDIVCPSLFLGKFRSEIVDFVFYDDCNNVLVTSAMFSIVDTLGPVIIDCPSDIVYTLEGETCDTLVTIHIPIVSDGCGVSEPFVDLNIVKLVTAENSDVNTIVDTIDYSFGPLNLSGSSVTSDAQFKISMANIDGNLETEFFTIVGENDEFIGITPKTQLECSDTFVVFTITAEQINNWAADDFIDFHLYPKVSSDPILAINDICNGSSVTASISFEVDVTNIINSTVQINDGLVFTPENNESFDTLLTIGEYHITYRHVDCAQNESTCTSDILITEIVPPTINCPNDTTIIIGIGDCTHTYLLPDIIYFDNCTEDHQNLHVYISGSTEIDSQAIIQENTPFELNKGENIFEVISFDESANNDTCRYVVNITDEEMPTVICMNDTIVLDINIISYVLVDIDMLGVDISDNCLVDSFKIYTDTIFCESIGSTVDVLVRVWDDSGNMSECINRITVVTSPLTPSYVPIKCDGDSLKLLSNITTTNGNLEYHWTGPDNFESFVADPIIIGPTNEASGTYHLEINEGQCIKSGTVEIIFELLEKPVIFNDNSTICVGDSIILVTTIYELAVNYNWYTGNINNSSFLATTNFNNIKVSPELGTVNYFVIITNDSCSSEPSDFITLEAINKPVAQIVLPLEEFCEGDSLFLETDLTFNNQYNYQWFGPDSYMSFGKDHVLIDATMSNAGNYQLVVSKGFCYSDTAIKHVIVNTRPQKPTISSSGVFCEDSDVLLTIENIDGDEFYWSKDGISFGNTNISEIVIPNANTDLDGKWNVQVRLGDCYSDTSFSHEIVIEEHLKIEIDGPEKACVGDTIDLKAPFIANASYEWKGPSNVSFNEQNLRLLAIEGEYTLTVITTLGCMNVKSLFLEVEDIPDITGISNDGDACVMNGSEIQLSATVFPLNDYTYTWTGPNGFFSNDTMPILSNIDSTVNGYYTLVIQNSYCGSKVDSSLIELDVIPSKPTIVIEEPYCRGSDVILEVSGESGSNITYQWNTPTGQIITTEPQLMIDAISNIQSGEYAVIILRNNCASVVSETVMVDLKELPSPIGIVGDHIICEGETIELKVSSTTSFEVEWMAPDGSISNDSVFVIEDFEEGDAGPYFVRVFDGQCFAEWSVPKVLTMQALPMTALIDTYSERICLGSSAVLNICLDETTMTDGASYHLYSVGNEASLGGTDIPCFDVDNFENIVSGSNLIKLETELNGCKSDTVDTIEIFADLVPLIEPIIDEGPEIHFCLESDVSLNTNSPDSIGVYWYNDEDYIISPTDSNSVNVNDLDLGKNSVYLSYSYNSCHDYAVDTIDIYLEESPLAFDDDASTGYNEKLTITVLDNDEYTSEVVVKFDNDQDIDGVVEVHNNEIVFTPNRGFIGELSFEYEICNYYCEEKCNIASINVKIGDAYDCFAANIITPNGDDINDVFIIPCLESDLFPNNKLIIMNQWGDSVYEASPYANDWSGTYKNKGLPSGTYYYILDIGVSNEQLKGFLVIER